MYVVAISIIDDRHLQEGKRSFEEFMQYSSWLYGKLESAEVDDFVQTMKEEGFSHASTIPEASVWLPSPNKTFTMGEI